MARSAENPHNRPVLEVKTELSNLKTKIEGDAGYNETDTTVEKMNQMRAKIAEAKDAAAIADKEKLEELSQQIDATDGPLDKFITDAYYDEAAEFKNEVQELKTVLEEKIAEPRTTMEKVGSMMEKAGAAMGKAMEKIGKIFSNMGTGALKGLRAFLELMGVTSMSLYLDGLIKPREVQDILRSRFPGKEIKKSPTDANDVGRLEAEWRAKLTADGKTEAAYPFISFCTDKARALADDPNKANYTIADLITDTTPVQPQPQPDPNKPADPNKPPEGMKETPTHQKAKYTYALAEAFNMVASGNPYTGFVDLNKDVIQNELQSDAPNNYKTVINRMLNEMNVYGPGGVAYVNPPASSRLFGIALDSGTLEEEDWNNWADINIDTNFEANMKAGNVKAVIDILKGFTYTDDLSKIKMPLVIEQLEKSLEKYGLN